MGLYEDLKAMRYARAQALGQPAFCVFSNKVLDEIVAQRPSSMAQLLAIKGFGQAKAQQVGAEIIALCSAAGSGPAPPPRLATVAPSAAPASGGAWSAHDDQRLWSSRSQPMSTLAATFSRGEGAIRSRIKHLQDPQHSAYKRLHGSGGDEGGSRPAKAARVLPQSLSASTGALPAAASDPTAKVDEATLNAEQKEAAQRALRGESVFLTGAAGVGKSYLLKFIVRPSAASNPDAAPGLICSSHATGLTWWVRSSSWRRASRAAAWP